MQIDIITSFMQAVNKILRTPAKEHGRDEKLLIYLLGLIFFFLLTWLLPQWYSYTVEHCLTCSLGLIQTHDENFYVILCT